MSDLLPDDNLLDESEASEEGNPALRVFIRALLVSAVATFALGFLAGAMEGGSAGNLIVTLLVFAILGIPVVCLVAGVVYLVRGQRAHALGFLLAALATPIIGFGACLGSLMLSGM